MPPLTVLITNWRLGYPTGSELFTRDLACALVRRGHRVIAYSPILEEGTEELCKAGVAVVDDLETIQAAPDVIHGQHHVQAMEAMLHFPRVPAVFICHGRTMWPEIPPLGNRVGRCVAVDLNTRERLVETYGIAESRVELILNAVDTDRFRPRAPLPSAPSRALVFSNYASLNTHLEPIREACKRLGIALEVIGLGSGNLQANPERLLGGYDLVFAKARCALEAMATGAAVILCDTVGLGPMVTLDRVEALRPWNFGARCLTDRIEPEAICREIGRYDAADAAGVSAYIRERATLSAAIDQYLAVYRKLLAEPAPRSGKDALLRDYFGEVAWRLGEFEARLRDAASGESMEIFPPENDAKLRLELREAPARVQPGGDFGVQVELSNDSEQSLSSHAPHPVTLSYRWEGSALEPTPGVEPRRTRIDLPLRPGERRPFTVIVAAPAIKNAARLRLRVTLIQEGIRWFDQSAAKVMADVPVEVGPR